MSEKFDQCARLMVEASGEAVSQKDALDVIKSLVRRAKNISANPEGRLLGPDQAFAKALEDTKGDISKASWIIRRNSFMTINVTRKLERLLDAGGVRVDKTLMHYLEDPPGAGKGVNSVINGYRDHYYGGFVSEMEESGLFKEFVNDVHSEDIYTEFYALEGAKSAQAAQEQLASRSASGNPKAHQIAQIMFGWKRKMVADENLFGSFIRFLPEHVTRQAYDAVRIVQQFGPERFRRKGAQWTKMTDKESVETVKNLVRFLTEDRGGGLGPRVDFERTFGSDDPVEFIQGWMQRVLQGKAGHSMIQHANGANVNVSFTKAGSLAKMASQQRLIHFRDGAAAYEISQLLSPHSLSQGFQSDLERGAANIGLMQMLGPNPKATLEGLLAKARDRYSAKANEGSGDALQRANYLKRAERKIMASLANLDGSAHIPDNVTVANITAGAMHFISATRLGGLGVTAIVDRPLISYRLLTAGVGALEAVTAPFRLFRVSNPYQKRLLRGYGAGLKQFIGHANANMRHMTGVEGNNGFMDRAAKRFFSMTGINYLDDIATEAYVASLARRLGSEWDQPMAQLLPDVRALLQTYGITPARWDAMRSTAFSLDTANGDLLAPGTLDDTWIAPDRFRDIPSVLVDKVLRAEGRKISATNRERLKTELIGDFQGLLTSERQGTILTPGARERRLTSGGTQAGTAAGSVWRLLTMFKSFPLTAWNRIVGRERQLAQAAGAIPFVNLRFGGLMASLMLAGYTSMTIDDLLKGKTRRKFFDKDGRVHGGSFKLLAEVMQKGGVFGLYQDLLLNEYDSGYKSVARQLGGPALSAVEDVAALASQTLRLEGESAKKRLVKMAKQNTPFLNLIYIRPAVDHLIWNNLQNMVDPGWQRRLERRLKKDYDQGIWNP